MSKKCRADQLLMQNHPIDSRTKAQALIMAGLVYLGEMRINKASELLNENDILTIRGDDCPFVSRGGLKLAHALQEFSFDPKAMICADIGASTGGFCDVLLQANVQKIYAVDVGYGQLHEKIRADSRVKVMERTNARQLSRELIPDILDLIVCDASFIGLEKVLTPVHEFLKSDGHIIALIKPQFQLSPKFVKKGIVQDAQARLTAVEFVKDWFASIGFSVLNLTTSPITGAKGNVEYLIIAQKLSANGK